MMDRAAMEMLDLWRRSLRQSKSERRATLLLLDNLTDAQAASFIKRGYFYVKGGLTGAVYRISPFSRVVQYDARGRAVAKLCFEARAVPHADTMLAQKIALESDEAHALKVANIFEYRAFACDAPIDDVIDDPCFAVARHQRRSQHKRVFRGLLWSLGALLAAMWVLIVIIREAINV